MGIAYKDREMSLLLDRLFLGLNGGLKQSTWSSDMWACFRLLFKGVGRIGLELEYLLTEENVPVWYNENREARRKGKGFFRFGFRHTNTSSPPFAGQEWELVQLFPCSSPTNLLSTIVKFHASLKKLGISTMGSVHLSIVLKQQSPAEFSLFENESNNLVTDFEWENKPTKQHYRRFENKKFSGFLLTEDLLAQMLLAAFACQTCQLSDYTRFLRLVTEARDSTIGTKSWAKVDLDLVLL